jgi:adenylate kinase
MVLFPKKNKALLCMLLVMDKYRGILIFGAPGSGKGTLARFLSASPLLYHLSSGEFFRGLSPSSEAGKIFHSFADKGQLVPDAVTMKLWSEYVETLVAANRFDPKNQWLLLDGIPRTKSQADLIMAYVDIAAVIVLDVPHEEQLIARITKRADEEKRADDANPAVIQKRLDVFKKETLAVLEGYPENMIHHINAEQRPLEVARDALIVLSQIILD